MQITCLPYHATRRGAGEGKRTTGCDGLADGADKKTLLKLPNRSLSVVYPILQTGRLYPPPPKTPRSVSQHLAEGGVGFDRLDDQRHDRRLRVARRPDRCGLRISCTASLLRSARSFASAAPG